MSNILSSVSDLSWMQLAMVAGAVSAGVGSGMMYVFSTGVMQGLGQLAPSDAVRAMQAINVAVINPLFLGVFMGTGLFLVGLAALDGAQAASTNPWLVAGAGVYAVGVVMVTIGGNVPLNDALATLDPDALTPGAWKDYAVPWLRWNHLRAAAAAVSSGLMTLAVLR